MAINKKYSIFYISFIVFGLFNPSFGLEESLLEPNFSNINEIKQQKNQNHFNLANIVDSFLTSENNRENTSNEDKINLRKDFISITSKFNQGNAKVAYDEYSALIDKTDNDTSLLTLAKIFYEIGLFSLANKASEKIIYKNQFYDNMLDLETSFKPKAVLNLDEEIYFAKQYSNIYFLNSAQETINELNEKKNQYQKNDFYHFVLSRAYLELSQYNNALHHINKAISINSNNINYQIFKCDILIKNKKYKEAKNTLDKIKNKKNIIYFSKKIELLDQEILSLISNNSTDKKYYALNEMFLEGNFEKTKKECDNILNFDKENDKIMTLYAKSELALGNIERANTFFVNSYKINKNNIDTLIGLGDIRYIHGDYKNSVKSYKKAYSQDKDNNEILIKLLSAQRQWGQKEKEIKKLEQKLDKMPKSANLDYYKSAISIAQKNAVLKEDFLKKSLSINPLYENALGELVELHLKNRNFQLAKNLIYNLSITLEKNYYYYYLCGLYNQMMNKKQEAIQFYKTSLNLNPNFEIANTKLLKLIPDIVNEEI